MYITLLKEYLVVDIKLNWYSAQMYLAVALQSLDLTIVYINTICSKAVESDN